MLPAALELGVRIDAAPAELITLTSQERAGAARLFPDGTPVDESPHGWARYVAAVAVELAAMGRPPAGLEGEISSTLPIGTGLSSSAALEIAVAVALCDVAEFEPEPLQLALAAQRAEYRAVGVPCGVMDQAASVLARAGHLLLLDTSSLEFEHVPFPPELALVIVESGVSRRLEHSGYGERRGELLEGVAALGGRDVRALTVADVAELGLSERASRRLRHVVSENGRVREAVRALREPTGFDRLGELFREGHESLHGDLEVTTPELDLLVDLAYASGAVAARMTGGGFGGSIVALAAADEAETISSAIAAAYGARTGHSGRAIVCRPGDGARELG